ncbi:MAG: bifunctional enoyl-CoA hydratase/phosphate acetyltransferase [Rickettsiales bacterium]
MIESNSCLGSKTYDEINLGDSASLTRILTKRDIQLFAIVTGDMNPAHLDEAYAKTDIFQRIIGHGMWTGSMFSSLLGMQLPGLGTIYLSQTLKFLRPVHLGDTITASVKVIEKDDKHKHVKLATICVNESGQHVLEGEAVVLPPEKKVCWSSAPLPEINIKTDGHNYEQWLLNKARELEPLKTAVVHPVDILSLSGAVEAAQMGIIEPVLVGNEEKIRKVADDAHIDLSKYRIVSTEHSHLAADTAAKMARDGEVEALMKGKIKTSELIEAVLKKENGLRSERRLSHVFVLDVPSYPKPLFLTDAAINIAPNLMDKKDIVQNVVDLFHCLGLGIPKVAILAAVETVNEKMPATIDATALCKMAERGQIKDAIIDGPLAFDNAISKESADIKEIRSDVAGNADILVVPDIESGNMLYKQLRYFSGIRGASIVMGAKVPIILTSRSSDVENRVISSALAMIYARANKT